MDANMLDFEMNVASSLRPVLIIPKICTNLKSNLDDADEVLIQVNITSFDLEGNNASIYSGLCYIKLTENHFYDETVYPKDDQMEMDEIIEEHHSDTGDLDMCIDPRQSIDAEYQITPTERYSLRRHTRSNRITVEDKLEECITKNIFSYEQTIQFTEPVHDLHESIRFDSVNSDAIICESSFTKLSTDEKSKKEKVKNKDAALQQLMSTDIQSVSKQRKTILFVGQEAHNGQTVQKISINDPKLECLDVRPDINHDTYDELPKDSSTKNHKKFQCDKCNQMFDGLASFKQHMVATHPRRRRTTSCQKQTAESIVKFFCSFCEKSLKTKEKFDAHIRGHGDPDVECDICFKVFASKFTLKNHRKTHLREHPCHSCDKSFTTADELQTHFEKVHELYTCDNCGFATVEHSEMEAHKQSHETNAKEIPNDDYNQTDEILSKTEIKNADDVYTDITDMMESCDRFPECTRLRDTSDVDCDVNVQESDHEDDDDVKQANDVIAKVMSNEAFLAKTGKKYYKYSKTCNVCQKKFDRIGDLKRHLIEHVIRSTLSKNPVSKDGTLKLQCQVCFEETFTRIDKYKAHLRDHAKLTLYQCTFCDKSFSDSSNFSKHKKVHGVTYLQCDLCNRKFNSKKMIAQHMEYHNRNEPLPCRYCDKIFHFESTLNKHIKMCHSSVPATKFRCKFCHDYFPALKHKWDHEWNVHNVRKIIVDCLLCQSKFRKYSELKRHCTDVHNMNIPTAKKLLRRKEKSFCRVTMPPE